VRIYWRFPKGEGPWLSEELPEEEAHRKEKTLLNSGFDVLVGMKPPREYRVTRQNIEFALRNVLPPSTDIVTEEEVFSAVLPPFNQTMLRKHLGIVRNFIISLEKEIASAKKLELPAKTMEELIEKIEKKERGEEIRVEPTLPEYLADLKEQIEKLG